jgi:hypothetical protein
MREKAMPSLQQVEPAAKDRALLTRRMNRDD